MDKQTDRKKPSLKERLLISGDFDIGADFYVELAGNANLCLRGCRGIAEYGDTRISLRVRKGTVCIDGESLICNSYTNGAVSVSGKISAVTFCTAEDKK